MEVLVRRGSFRGMEVLVREVHSEAWRSWLGRFTERFPLHGGPG